MIIKCNLCLHFNKAKTKQYLLNEKKITASDTLIAKVFNNIRETLYYYYSIVYEVEEFGIEGSEDFYSCDESLFTHFNNEAIWVLNVVNTDSKEFRIVATTSRDGEILKKFITKFVPSDSKIVTDGWSGYNFLNDNGYVRYEHNHGAGDFGEGKESTSHYEGLWVKLKEDIISTYHCIPCKNFLYFFKEEEFKYINRKKIMRILLKNFLNAINFVNSVDLDYVENPDFLNNNYFK